jgi:hypothetical protein
VQLAGLNLSQTIRAKPASFERVSVAIFNPLAAARVEIVSFQPAEQRFWRHREMR